MESKEKIKTIFFQISAILILVAAVVHSFDTTVAKYMMLIGVSGFGATTFTTPYKGKSLRGKRLFNIMVFAVLLMVAATYLMFVDIDAWVILMLIAALFTLYATIMLSKAYKEEEKGDK